MFPPQQGPPPLKKPGAGAPMPGQGADPMEAMMGQLGPGAMGMDPMAGMGGPPPPSFPAGPDGMPFGSSMPSGPGDEGMEGAESSPLLQALLASVSGGGGDMGMGGGATGDPYGLPPGGPDHALDGGVGDPSMGLQQMLEALALAQMGVGGGAQQGVMPGGSGADQFNPRSTGIGGIGGMGAF